MRSSLIVLCMLFCLSIKASDESGGLVVKSFDKFTFNSYNDVDIKRLYNKQKNNKNLTQEGNNYGKRNEYDAL